MKQKDMALATKKQLAAALKALMARKPITKITVRELVAECGLNRNSFYYHFEDIYALLKWTLEAEAFSVVMQYSLPMDYREVINFVLDYVEQNQYLLTNAFNSVGQEGLKHFLYIDFIECIRALIDRLEALGSTPLAPDFKAFLSEFYAEAIAGTLLGYLQHPEKRSREQIIQYIEQILNSTPPMRTLSENQNE